MPTACAVKFALVSLLPLGIELDCTQPADWPTNRRPAYTLTVRAATPFGRTVFEVPIRAAGNCQPVFLRDMTAAQFRHAGWPNEKLGDGRVVVGVKEGHTLPAITVDAPYPVGVKVVPFRPRP